MGGITAESLLRHAALEGKGSFGANNLVTEGSREISKHIADSMKGFAPGTGETLTYFELNNFVEHLENMKYSLEIVQNTSYAAATNHGAKVVTFGTAPQNTLALDPLRNMSIVTDEYAHVWNATNGRGVNLPADLAKIHVDLSKISMIKGTDALEMMGDFHNTLYHQLEFANMYGAGLENFPLFMQRMPKAHVDYFINNIRPVAIEAGLLEMS